MTDFSRLGGHSLSAAQVIQRIRRRFGVELRFGEDAERLLIELQWTASNRHVSCRSTLRRILARCPDIGPAAIAFEYNRYGTPRWRECSSMSHIRAELLWLACLDPAKSAWILKKIDPGAIEVSEIESFSPVPAL